MDIRCPGCGYEPTDEVDFLAHLTECPNKPEERWETYAGVMENTEQPFKNSEILKEE